MIFGPDHDEDVLVLRRGQLDDVLATALHRAHHNFGHRLEEIEALNIEILKELRYMAGLTDAQLAELNKDIARVAAGYKALQDLSAAQAEEIGELRAALDAAGAHEAAAVAAAEDRVDASNAAAIAAADAAVEAINPEPPMSDEPSTPDGEPVPAGDNPVVLPAPGAEGIPVSELPAEEPAPSEDVPSEPAPPAEEVPAEPAPEPEPAPVEEVPAPAEEPAPEVPADDSNSGVDSGSSEG